MKKKIAVYFPSMADGGAERITLNLIRHLAEHYDYPIDLVLVSATGPFIKDVPTNVRIVDLKARRSLTSIPGLVKYLRKERPHVLLSGMDFVNVIALLSRKLARVQTRTVVCLHTNLTAQLANPVLLRGRFIVPFLKWTHPWADTIVATSKGCGDDFLEVTGVGKENMELIYNPVITSDIKPKADRPVDHRWFSADSPPVILAVGRLARQKNFEMLINAFALLRKTHDAKLLILGEGVKRGELEGLVESLGLQNDVDMPGFADNPFSYMAKAKMFVLSSHYEALPTVLVEAMHCGTQLVSTDCPSGPNEILAYGKYGSLVPVNDAAAFCNAMISALETDQFIQDEKACNPFIDKNVVSQYLDVLVGRD